MPVPRSPACPRAARLLRALRPTRRLCPCVPASLRPVPILYVPPQPSPRQGGHATCRAHLSRFATLDAHPAATRWGEVGGDDRTGPRSFLDLSVSQTSPRSHTTLTTNHPPPATSILTWRLSAPPSVAIDSPQGAWLSQVAALAGVEEVTGQQCGGGGGGVGGGGSVGRVAV